MMQEGKEHHVRVIFLDTEPYAPLVRDKAKAVNAGPHDVLIVKDEVWCFVKDVAFKHPDHTDHAAKALPGFQEALLIVQPGDSVTWACDRTMLVTLTPVEPPDRPVPPRAAGWSPELQPFENVTPFRGYPQDPARSGVVRKSAENTQYKVGFLIDNVSYDPDIFCGNGN